MSEPVEFSSFYQLLKSVKQGSEERIKELEWMLAEYEHAKESKNAYDELGQIFCHHGIMELYEYTGIDNIQLISNFEDSVWSYLTLRMNYSLPQYMIKSMMDHAEEHSLAQKMSEKWKTSTEEIKDNLEGLARYVTEGIIEIIHKY